MRRQIGFTLIELMIALVVLAVLAVVGAPAMSSFFEKRRVTDAAMAVYSQLQLARSTAIANSTDITVVVSGSGSSWVIGLTDDDDNSCDLSITAENVQTNFDNGDADPFGDACAIDTDLDDADPKKQELHRLSADQFSGVTFSAPDDGWTLIFDSMRGTAPARNVTFTSDGDAAYNLSVYVLPLGQVKVCSSNMPGYGSCPS